MVNIYYYITDVEAQYRWRTDSSVQLPLTRYVTLSESLGPRASVSLFIKYWYLSKALKKIYKWRYKVLFYHRRTAALL